MKPIEVIGLGALNMDYLYRVERIIGDGETVVKEVKPSPGGSAANTIYGLAKLGVNTGFIGVVGDDADGESLIQSFQKAGVDTSQIKVKPKTKTGSVLCLCDKLGRRSLYVVPGANNLLSADDLDLTGINRANMLHLSSFADGKQFQVLLELMGRLSTRLSFAPGSIYARKGFKALAPILNKTYVLFINHYEIQQLTGEDITTGAESCLKQGCNIVVVTLGKGMRLKSGEEINNAVCYIRDADQEYIVKSDRQDKISEVETTGAGDAFATGFLYGLLKGKELEECGYLGDITAKLSISKVGARQGLPTLTELTQSYQKLYIEET
ncbi:MAG: carbohydrate kinase family protein [Dehalococcoidales bacterium]|nr:carbohydrate kinase family protein [Dehalococcoidales bacterium]